MVPGFRPPLALLAIGLLGSARAAEGRRFSFGPNCQLIQQDRIRVGSRVVVVAPYHLMVGTTFALGH